MEWVKIEIGKVFREKMDVSLKNHPLRPNFFILATFEGEEAPQLARG